MTYSPIQPGQYLPARRDLLRSWCLGFGGLALADLLHAGDKNTGGAPAHPLAARKPHFKPRAKRIIFLFMHGGPSHIDLFDPKPELQKNDGKPPPFQRTRVKFAARGNLLASPWKFRPTGNRTTTTVPTQALFLMNNPWMNELAGDIAKNVTTTLKTDRERLSYLYESLLGRLPEEDDLTAAENLLETVREQADLEKLPLADWQALCHTMLMSSEFLYTR